MFSLWYRWFNDQSYLSRVCSTVSMCWHVPLMPTALLDWYTISDNCSILGSTVAASSRLWDIDITIDFILDCKVIQVIKIERLSLFNNWTVGDVVTVSNWSDMDTMISVWTVVEHVRVASGAAELAIFTAILYWFFTSRYVFNFFLNVYWTVLSVYFFLLDDITLKRILGLLNFKLFPDQNVLY